MTDAAHIFARGSSALQFDYSTVHTIRTILYCTVPPASATPGKLVVIVPMSGAGWHLVDYFSYGTNLSDLAKKKKKKKNKKRKASETFFCFL